MKLGYPELIKLLTILSIGSLLSYKLFKVFYPINKYLGLFVLVGFGVCFVMYIMGIFYFKEEQGK